MKHNSKILLRKVSSAALAAALVLGTTASVPFAVNMFDGAAGITANAADGEVFECTSTVSANKIVLGESVSITHSAKGAKPWGSMRYSVGVTKPGSTEVDWINKMSSSTSYTYTPDMVGTYVLTLEAYDTVQEPVTKTETLEVVEPEETFVVSASSTYDEYALNDRIVVKYGSEGGSGEVHYSAEYTDPDGSTTTALTNSTNTTLRFKAEKVGIYTVKITAVDEDNHTTSKEINVIVVESEPEIVYTPELSAEEINYGESVTVTHNSTGGFDPVRYSFVYENDAGNDSGTLQWHGEDKTYEFKPKKAGTYTLTFTAHGRHSDCSTTVSKTLKVNTLLKNDSTVESEAINLGEAIKINPGYSGNTGQPIFNISVKKDTDTDWTTVVEKTSSTGTVEYSPAETGTYSVKVSLTDDLKIAVDKVFDVTVKAAPVPTPIIEIKPSVVLYKNSVKIRCMTEGGTGNYRFVVKYKKSTDTKWATFAEGSSIDKEFKPKYPVNYDILVALYDENDTKVYRVQRTITVIDIVTEINSAVADPEVPVVVAPKVPVTVKAAAEGSKTPFKYAVFYKKATDEKWACAQDFDYNDTVTFKPAKQVMYDVCVKAKDAKGNIVKKYYKVDIRNVVKNTSTISADEILKGEQVTVNCSGAEGKEPYTYRVLYKKSTDEKYAEVQNFSENATVSFKPSKAPLYDVRVIARDSNGSEGIADFQVAITDF